MSCRTHGGGTAFRCLVSVTLCSLVLAAGAGSKPPSAGVDYFKTTDPDLTSKNVLVITNAIGKWPSPKQAGRIFFEIENLDGHDGEIVKFSAYGVNAKGKSIGSLERWEDLPDCGRKGIVVPMDVLAFGLDLAKIGGIRLALEKGVSKRFGVRQIRFLASGEELPKVDAAPRRNRKAEREHAASLEKFRNECGADGLAVGVVSSMEAVRPRSGFAVRPATNVSVRLARNEYESLQVVVASVAGDLKDARVEFAPFVSDGNVFAATNLTCSPVGYVDIKTVAQYGVRPSGTHPDRGWWPDAILDFTNRADIAEGDAQSFWIRVKCPRGQRAGVYAGAMTVRATQNGKPLSRQIPVTLRVNGFEVPDKSMLPLAVSFKVGACGAKAKALLADTNGMHTAWRRHESEYGDFLSDYKIPWDMLYANDAYPPHYEVLKKCKDQGRLGMFNLAYWDFAGLGTGGEKRWRETRLPKICERYDRARELGIADHAYFYGCDELGEKVFANIAFTADLLHREFPGVKLMTTAQDRKLGVDGSVLTNIDIFCPATCFWNPKQVAKSRAAGHQVWWYFCNAPSYPLANTMIETPPIEIRSFMGAQSIKYRPDGFLYYATASWNGVNPIREPFYDWNASSFTTRYFYHGDGQWTCCGGPDMLPLPTLRLENFRDGLEDYAYAKILERCLADCAGRDAVWTKRAREALAVPTTLVKSLSDFSIDPSALYAWRNSLADLIESCPRGCKRDSVSRPGLFHRAELRAHVGIPSIAVSPANGRMWATWYNGKNRGEDYNNYVCLVTSADGGASWKEVLVADPDEEGPKRAFDPELWIAPDGKLRWTWTERVCDPLKGDPTLDYGTDIGDEKTDVVKMATLLAEEEPALPVEIVDVGPGVMMCKPIVRKCGEWLMPVAHWYGEPSSCFYASADGGRTFAYRGGATIPKELRLFDEHQTVERENGDLVVCIRSKKNPWVSISHDGGRTWENSKPAPFGHTSSRLFFSKIKGGNWLLVKHGPIDMDVGRRELMAYLSKDEGKTWIGGLVLDERGGVSYPDGQQLADGSVVIVYDRNRLTDREILFATFTEADVVAGGDVSGKVRLRQVITSGNVLRGPACAGLCDR